MKKNIIAVILCVLSVPLFAQNKDAKEFKSEKEKLSYIIGVNVAQSIKQQNMQDDVDAKIISEGIASELAGKKSVISEEEMNSTMQNYFTKKREEISNKNQIEGQKFLAENKNKKGVITTASGLQYEVISKGQSKEHPTTKDVVKVKYEGKLINGKIFDSTNQSNNGQPIEFPLDGVIKGWVEGIQLMTKGSKYRLFIPADLAYGKNGAGQDIGPNSTLIFDVELIDFKPAEQQKETPKADKAK